MLNAHLEFHQYSDSLYHIIISNLKKTVFLCVLPCNDMLHVLRHHQAKCKEVSQQNCSFFLLRQFQRFCDSFSSYEFALVLRFSTLVESTVTFYMLQACMHDWFLYNPERFLDSGDKSCKSVYNIAIKIEIYFPICCR